MPLPRKPRKGATKKQRQKVAGDVIKELKGTGRPLKQRIAIGLKQAGLNRKLKPNKRLGRRARK